VQFASEYEEGCYVHHTTIFENGVARKHLDVTMTKNEQGKFT